ncbi:hypothetical protein CBS101457_001676 [Exobasidium rhododendri]|nr:hypothetical protein CBS101457_001676 [Exobasidium rhododendri]
MGGRGESPRGRSQRIRRPPKAYQGAVSWEEAESSKGLERKSLSTAGGQFPMEGGGRGVVGRDDTMGEDVDSDDISMDDYDGNTSDEFVPDDDNRLDHLKRKSGDGKAQQDDFGSDSGEEFGSSDQSLDSDGGEGGEPTVHSTSNIDPRLSQNDFERASRAKKRMLYQSLRRGGLENPEGWREVGQRNRQKQKQDRERASPEREGVVEVEESEIQNLADAFSGRGNDATIAQVERWQSALHVRDQEPEDEELDEDAFEQDVRGAVGFKRKKRIRGKDGVAQRAPRQIKLPAPVAALLSEANIAFIEGDLASTISKLEEVIRLEPAIRSAWATLALCFSEQDRPAQAMQCRIMEAHLTSRSIDLWADLASSSKEMGLLEQTIYCLTKAISSSREKDKSDVLDIMWERSQLYEEMDEPRRAAQGYLRMLQYRPQNQSIIRQLIPLLFQLDMLHRAIDILQKCEEWNMEAFPDPLIDPAMLDTEADVGPDLGNTYDSNEVVTLADLLLRDGRPQEALHTIRRGARWLDGRGFEGFWDDVLADDREFDESREETEDRESTYGRRVELAPVHYLEPEFRFQLAMARARLGDSKECRRHFDIWRRDAHVGDQMDHFTEMADEYIRLGSVEKVSEEMRMDWFDEALQITTNLLAERQVTNEDTDGIIGDYKRIAGCYMGLNDSQQAAEWLKPVIEYNPDDFESMLRLAEAYENMGQRETAIDLVTELVRSKRERQVQSRPADSAPIAANDPLTQSMSFFAEIQSKSARDGEEGINKQTMREQRKEFERIREVEAGLSWSRLKAKEEEVFFDGWWSVDVDFVGGGEDVDHGKRRYGDPESTQARMARFDNVTLWLADAEQLVNQFQNTPQLYPKNRTKKFRGVFRTKKKKADMVDSQANAILARLGDELLFDELQGGRDTYEFSTFRGITLDDWVTLIMQYAFVLTKVGEFETAEGVINSVLKSSVVWTDEERKRSVQICLASCALYAQQYGKTFDHLTFLTTEYQFHNEPLRIIFTLANSIGFSSFSFLNEQSSLKKFHRRIRIHDVIAQGGACVFSRTNKRWIVKEKLNKRLGKGVGEDETDSGEEDDGEEDDDEEEEDDDDDEQDEDGGEDQALSAAAGRNEYAVSSMRAQDTWQVIREESDITPLKHAPPRKINPANDAFYGCLLLPSSNGVPSMAYFTRTFARQQNDPLICLTSAIACFGRAQNRQVDNRHQVIVQGFAFLDRYRTLRRDQSLAASSSEVEYNFGRTFHLLGLYQLAVPHYQKVLEMHEKGDKAPLKAKQTGFLAWPEAAYNLVQIYLISGNTILANQVLERYLIV